MLLRLKIYINDFTIPKAIALPMGQALLVDSPPEAMLFPLDLIGPAHRQKASSMKKVSP